MFACLPFIDASRQWLRSARGTPATGPASVLEFPARLLQTIAVELRPIWAGHRKRLRTPLDSADLVSMNAASLPLLSIAKSQAAKFKRHGLLLVAAWAALVYAPCKADVPAPPAPPPVPAGYCSSIYNELNGDLQAFNTQLTTTTPSWTPVSLGPTLNATALAWANSDTGPALSSPGALQTVQAQLQAVKALGVQGVSIPILFPVLYAPFYGAGSAGQTAMQPYLTFYESVAQAVRAAGLKLIVDDEIVFSNDIQAGWTNMNAFYSTLSWPEYMAARATQAATIAQIYPAGFSVGGQRAGYRSRADGPVESEHPGGRGANGGGRDCGRAGAEPA